MMAIGKQDIIILGSGPAGLTAALYCARAGKATLVLGGEKLGGQMSEIAVLENYPGWMGSGLELAEFMKHQAESFGAKFVFTLVKKLSGNAKSGFSILASDGKKYTADAVIIATGASPKKLEIAGAGELIGRGVCYCATCDGFFYSGGDVAVIGGGNSALSDALYLADIAKTVTIIYRRAAFTRAESVLRERVSKRKNIKCLFSTELKQISSLPNSDKLVLTTKDDGEIIVDGVFVAIGHEANTDYLPEEIARDALGRLVRETLPLGLFVAGDIRSDAKMQVATAVGGGCAAAMNAIEYLNSKN